MTHKATFHVPDGSTLNLDGRRWLVVGKERDGYAVEGIDDGECTTLHFERVDAAIKAETCEVTKPADAEKRRAILEYTGGYERLEQLPEEVQGLVRARLAVVLAMDALEAEGHRLTQRNMSRGPTRNALLKHARTISRDDGLFGADRGGKLQTSFILPKGRTLQKYRDLYYKFGADPIVLMDRDHLKGPRGEAARKLCDLQERFIDYVINGWMDKRKPELAPFVRGAEEMFDVPAEDVARGFKFPSVTTIRTRIKMLSKVVKDLGRRGNVPAVNRHGASSTSVRALLFGERGEMDQVYLSIFVDCNGDLQAKEIDPETASEELEENEVRRVWLHFMIDVATRLPLAWIIADSADADHAMALLRMATRDKTREKVRYGCASNPAPAAGLLLTSADNGTATRNSEVYAAQLGLDMAIMTSRAYRANDKPFVERPFGTLQFGVLNFHPGYTGSGPGDLESYDPKPSAALDHDTLYGVLTRYFVDEYPYKPHRGTGMYRATPWQKYLEVRETYGEIEPPSPQKRRLHLGYKIEATITKNGVEAFKLPFNSTEIQRFAGGESRRVTVHLDPDNLRHVEVTAEGEPQVMTAHLTMGIFRDMTLEEALDLINSVTEANPELREHHEELYRNAVTERASRSDMYSNPRDPASYRTLEALKKKADQLAHVELRPPELSLSTAPPGSVTSRTPSTGVHTVPKPSEAPEAGPAAGDPFKPIKESKF